MTWWYVRPEEALILIRLLGGGEGTFGSLLLENRDAFGQLGGLSLCRGIHRFPGLGGFGHRFIRGGMALTGGAVSSNSVYWSKAS